MVRKIELKLIEDELSRQLSFAKRRNGLVKKALELHMVCGLDCLFISFSPSGRLSCFSGDKRAEDILARFATVPENLRKFHLSELELQQFISILKELKEQTEEHLESDRTISLAQEEILKVKEKILQAKAQLRRYQPLARAIMTVNEANTSEGILEEALAKVQERKKELMEYHDNTDASQPSDSMVVVENSSTNPSDEIQQAEVENQPNEESNKDQDQMLPHQSPSSEGQIAAMMESVPPASLLFEMPSLNPYQAATSFTSLLLSADLPDQSFSLFTETVPTMPLQNNNGGSLQQMNQFNVFQDGVLNTHFYSKGTNPRESNQIEPSERIRSTYESPNNNMNFADFQMPQQILQHSNPSLNFGSFSSNFLGNNGDIQQQMLTTSSSAPLFSSLQWDTQNSTSLGGGLQELLNSVAGLNMLQDPTTPLLSNPPNRLTNHQPTGSQNTEINVPLNMQPSLTNSTLQGEQGNKNCALPRKFEKGGSSSSAQKRKLPWNDVIFLRLSNSPNGNASSNSASHAPRPPRNLAYNTAYEIMGLPIDPHFRMFQEMLKNDKGKQQQSE